jgi:exodeoxyribonuclease V gamma subunit
VAGFLRQGLDVGLPADHAETQDGIPLQLDGLEQWQVGDRILQRLLGSDTDGEEAQRVLTAEMLRGELPPRRLGERLLHELCTRVQALATASQADRTAGPTVLDVAADLGDGRRLTGAVPDVRGSRIVRVHYSSLSAKHRLASWVDLVALSAAYPDTSWTAATYGWFRRYGKEGVAWSLLGPVEDPSRLLGELVDLRDRGLREPLPLFLKTSAAWAKAGGGEGGQRAATWAWRGSDRVPGEDADPAHVRVYGPGTDLLGLLGHPRDDERWSDREPTRVGQYAARLWAPLLAAETGRNV